MFLLYRNQSLDWHCESKLTLHKKMKFSIKEKQVFCGFSHIYRKNPSWKSSIFMQYYLTFRKLMLNILFISVFSYVFILFIILFMSVFYNNFLSFHHCSEYHNHLIIIMHNMKSFPGGSFLFEKLVLFNRSFHLTECN